MKEGKLEELKRLIKNRKKYLWQSEKRIIKNETNEEKSLIGINRGQGNTKQEKREERQFPHQRQLVIESIIDLDKIREIIPEKRYYQNTMKPSGPTHINSTTV